MMRKLLCGAAAAVCLGAAGPAMANGSLKDVEPVQPAPTWTGFYLGAGIGAGAVVHDLDVDAFADELDKGKCEKSGSGYTCSDGGRFNLFDASLGFDGIGGEGVIGTFQVGYDWQNWSRWVVGVFADADISGIETDLDFSANAANGFALSGDGEVDMDWMWTIGARIGYLTTPDTMLYLLLGYSQAEFDDPSLSVNFDPDTANFLGVNESESVSADLDTFDGFTIGAGMETRLSRNWGLKLEYRFTQFSDEDLFDIQGPIFEEDDYVIEAGASAELEPSLHTGRLVLTYRFNRAPEPIETFK